MIEARNLLRQISFYLVNCVQKISENLPTLQAVIPRGRALHYEVNKPQQTIVSSVFKRAVAQTTRRLVSWTNK